MGLVKRRPDERDRRGYIIQLTAAGIKLADKAITRHFSAVNELLDVLSGNEQDQLGKLLSKLLLSFELGDEKLQTGRVSRAKLRVEVD